jgi:ketosteroid isomerase-like protein
MADEPVSRERITALEARLQRLEDQQAIAQVVASYGPAVDGGDAGATAALWFEDGVFDVVPYFTLEGRDAIAGMVDGDGHQSLIRNGCGHVLTAPKVVVDGDRARAWNHALNIRWDEATDRFWVARVSANEWELRRGDDGWHVVRRTNINLDGDEGPRALFRRSTVDEPDGGTR